VRANQSWPAARAQVLFANDRKCDIRRAVYRQKNGSGERRFGNPTWSWRTRALVVAAITPTGGLGCSYKVDILQPVELGVSQGSDGDGDNDDAGGGESDVAGDGEGDPGTRSDGDTEAADGGWASPMAVWSWCAGPDGGGLPAAGDACNPSNEPCLVSQTSGCSYETTVCEGTQLRLGTVRRPTCAYSRVGASHCAERTTDCCLKIFVCEGTNSEADSLMEVCSPDCGRVLSDTDGGIYSGCPGTSWLQNGVNHRCTGDFICDDRGYPIGPDAPFESEDGSVYWCENNVLQRVFVPRRY
jgi:hypothetical protein